MDHITRTVKVARRKNGKVDHNKPRISTHPVPRLTRQGQPTYTWPHEHLSILFKMGVKKAALEKSGIRISWPKMLRVLNRNRPDIGRAYKAKMNKPLSSNVIYQRYNKGHLQNEQENYAEFQTRSAVEIDQWDWSK